MAAPRMNKYTRRNLVLVGIGLSIALALVIAAAIFARPAQLILPEERAEIERMRLAPENGYEGLVKASAALAEIPVPQIAVASANTVNKSVWPIANYAFGNALCPDDAPELAAYLDGMTGVCEQVRQALAAPYIAINYAGTLFEGMDQPHDLTQLMAIPRVYTALFLYHGVVRKDVAEALRVLDECQQFGLRLSGAGQVSSELKFRPEFTEYMPFPPCVIAQRIMDAAPYVGYCLREQPEAVKALQDAVAPHVGDKSLREVLLRSYCIHVDDTLVKPIQRENIDFDDRIRVAMVSRLVRDEAQFLFDNMDAVKERIMQPPDSLREWLESGNRYLRGDQRHHDFIKGPPVCQLMRYAAVLESRWTTAWVALALERCRAATGAFPELLDVLVPDYLDRIPPCPWDEQALRYKRTPDGAAYVLYTDGENKQDDGGIPRRDLLLLDYTASVLGNPPPGQR